MTLWLLVLIMIAPGGEEVTAVFPTSTVEECRDLATDMLTNMKGHTIVRYECRLDGAEEGEPT